MSEANEVKTISGMTFDVAERTIRFEAGRYTLSEPAIFSFDSYELRAVGGSGGHIDFEPLNATDSQEIEKQ